MLNRVKGIVTIAIILFIDFIAISSIAGGRYINYMPTIGEGKSIFAEFTELYFGKDLITIILSIISTVILYFSYKILIKDKKSIVLYILFFVIVSAINVMVYYESIGRVY